MNSDSFRALDQMIIKRQVQLNKVGGRGRKPGRDRLSQQGKPLGRNDGFVQSVVEGNVASMIGAGKIHWVRHAIGRSMKIILRSAQPGANVGGTRAAHTQQIDRRDRKQLGENSAEQIRAHECR